jgi:UDP:flavonoid glycosyltransferase YjiC (YdhE family)
MSARGSRKRVLFVAENVTLAQVVRLRVLAGALDPAHYEVSFACSHFDPLIFEGSGFAQHALYTRPAEELFRAMSQGRRLYEAHTLARYIEHERVLLSELEPDLVVGDLRLSLAISAPLARVPYAALINAYWSPLCLRDGFPMPDHPIVRLLGEELAARYFPKALPFVFDYFAKPINMLRKKHGLSALGSMPEVLTYGDYTLFADTPELTPLSQLPAHQRFLGPVLWEPALPRPAFLDEARGARGAPWIYVTLGSSGHLGVLPALLTALSRLPVRVMLASAGRPVAVADVPLPRNLHVAPYLPGSLASRHAALVICNGGSSTGYQALSEGTPVLGLPSNLDQYLAMSAIEQAGAGKALRASVASADAIERAVIELLETPSYRINAEAVQSSMQKLDCRQLFRGFVDEATSASSAQPRTRRYAHRGDRQEHDVI